MKKCSVCGRFYSRQKCEFCKRQVQWDKTKKYQAFEQFPKRLRKRIGMTEHGDSFRKAVSSLRDTENCENVLLLGHSGTRKTTYAIELMYEVMRLRFVERSGPSRSKFSSLSGVIEQIKESFGSDVVDTRDLIQKYKNVGFLVLDDIGVNKMTEWIYSTIYLLINYRYENLLPTVFITNFEYSELENNLDSRIASRLKDSLIIQF